MNSGVVLSFHTLFFYFAFSVPVTSYCTTDEHSKSDRVVSLLPQSIASSIHIVTS